MPQKSKTPPPIPRVMGAGRAAEELGVTRQTLSRWVTQGIIRPVGQMDVPGKNGAMIFKPSDVEKLKAERVAATP